MELLIDSDAGADDLAALALALGAPSAKVSAIIASYGNFAVEDSIKRIRGLVDALAPKYKPLIVRGCAKPLVDDYAPPPRIHGDYFLAPASSRPPQDIRGLDALQALEGQYTYVCIGPLTSLAELLKTPLAKRISKIVLMGGAFFYPGNATPLAEVNFYLDPEAVRRVFASDIPIYVIPLNVTETLQLTPDVIRSLRQAELFELFFSRYSSFYTHEKRSCLDPKDLVERSYVGGVLHDPLAVASVLDDQIVRFQELRVSLEAISIQRGFVFPILREEQAEKEYPRVHVAVSVDRQRFWEIFFKILPKKDAAASSSGGLHQL